MKLLLVGELNETLYSLNEYLSKSFQVQMCSENAQNIKDMIRLLRPSIVVMNVSEMKDDVMKIFQMLLDKLDTMPIVVIGTAQMNSDLQTELARFKKKKILTRPLNASDVMKACNEILNIDEKEKITEEQTQKIEKKKILVVDDNALILRKMKQLLEDEYQVFLANSGEKALESLEKKEINLILLDYEMPGMSGREVFEHVIANEKTKNIPVVFLTSVSDKNHIFEVLVNKPYGYILKPPAYDKIKSILKEALVER